MDKAEVRELTRYGWECPKCFAWHEVDDDPDGETLICEECESEFEADLKL